MVPAIAASPLLIIVIFQSVLEIPEIMHTM